MNNINHQHNNNISMNPINNRNPMNPTAYEKIKHGPTLSNVNLLLSETYYTPQELKLGYRRNLTATTKKSSSKMDVLMKSSNTHHTHNHTHNQSKFNSNNSLTNPNNQHQQKHIPLQKAVMSNNESSKLKGKIIQHSKKVIICSDPLHEIQKLDERNKSEKLIMANQIEYRKATNTNFVTCKEPHVLKSVKLTKRFEDLYETPNEMANKFLTESDIIIMKRDKHNFKNINYNFRTMDILKPQTLAEVLSEKDKQDEEDKKLLLDKKKKKKRNFLKEVIEKNKSLSNSYIMDNLGSDNKREQRGSSVNPEANTRVSFTADTNTDPNNQNNRESLRASIALDGAGLAWLKQVTQTLDDKEIRNKLENLQRRSSRRGNVFRESLLIRSTSQLTKKLQIMTALKELFNGKYGKYYERLRDKSIELDHYLSEHNHNLL